MINVTVGLLLPFLGTVLGAAAVVFMHKGPGKKGEANLSGFAAGVMTAASIWSLIIPAIEDSAELGAFSFFPAVIGIWAGVLFLVLSERMSASLERNIKESALSNRFLLVWAVVLHNIPEGMAVGLALASAIDGAGTAMTAALMLSAGIAIQNVPEGAIISMPLAGDGMKKSKALFYGTMSGVVEPVFALMTMILAECVAHVMPYLLGFAAGAMLYVSASELIPKAAKNRGRCVGGIGAFFLGFSVMMILDVVFS